eukprot:TRINITY_DN2119_c0_g1_i1.p1 TRINITY_DN2119_c0_g1~~TRINITY_DN2119_c0_g1_i1.p1  ORF type:complete len:310 (+),score=36.99 TRINITY_DN2119_c0_g1_i1:111-932(+)
MVGERLKNYIKESFGLEPNDVPRVVGTFVASKYVSAGVCVALGMRYKPFSWFFVRRRAFPALHVFKASQTSARSAFQKRVGAAFDVARGRYTAAKDHVRDARQRVKDAKDRWQLAGQQKTQQRHRLLAEHQRRAVQRFEQERRSQSWLYAWSSEWYWRLSEKLQNSVRKSRLWSMFSRVIGADPRGLALGLAEGLLLYKLSFPIQAPLLLWLSVVFSRRQRQEHLTTSNSTDVAEVRCAGLGTSPPSTAASLAATESTEHGILPLPRVATVSI